MGIHKFEGDINVTGNIYKNGILDIPCEEITYSALKAKRDAGELVPGRQYRITDYECTTTTKNTMSAGHPFDIIVTADSANTLNENARACLHEGNTYFINNNLRAWKLMYCLDNDTTRFAWADSANGKGVIYQMVDEFDNDVPYDFKNILFSDSASTPKYTNVYTFSYTVNNEIKDVSLLGRGKNCYNNIIRKYITLTKQHLNFNVFYSKNSNFDCYFNTFGNNCVRNTFGSYCFNIVFGEGCSNNTLTEDCANIIFGNKCFSNTLGAACGLLTLNDWCSSNTFGNYCFSLIFGRSCSGNMFGDNCSYNTFGHNCVSNAFNANCCSNTFGDSCSENSFGSDCSYNLFKSNCFSNTFATGCQNNTFGQNCSYITFGDSSSAVNYCRNIIVDNNCSYLYINSSDTDASSSNQLQNVHVHLGVTGASGAYKTLTVPDRNLQYETNFIADGTNNIIV